ncbi:ABC transporter C family member 10-like [Bidens hawaiensis]|uniref:ABC transporter C family member 10-like n=1 Tax=Bidens hawaiensis TaxID=980011 RepID=UPI00404919CC
MEFGYEEIEEELEQEYEQQMGRGRGRVRGRGRGQGQGRGRGPPVGDNVLVTYPHVQFIKGSDAHTRYIRLKQMHPFPSTIISWSFLESYDAHQRTIEYIGQDTPWSRCFSIPVSFHGELTLEAPRAWYARDSDEGARRRNDTVGGLLPHVRAGRPSLDGGVRGCSGAYTPRRRFLHRLIAMSIVGRNQGAEHCSLRDLFFLRCLLTHTHCNLARGFADYFVGYQFRQGRESLMGGGYVTQLAISLGHGALVDSLRIAPTPLSELDRLRCVGMHIVRSFPRPNGPQERLVAGPGARAPYVPVPLVEPPPLAAPEVELVHELVDAGRGPAGIRTTVVTNLRIRHVPRTYRSVRLGSATDARLQAVELGMRQMSRQIDWLISSRVAELSGQPYSTPPPPPPSFDHEASTSGVRRGRGDDMDAAGETEFRNRVTRLQVKSMLCAAIYQKELRLSNDARLSYSPGQIMNYATVDANRIGEFPFWFHQIWTIGLQICLGIFIIYFAVGVAAFAALLVIILTVLGSIPLGKLQLKILRKLMVAQDRRLKAITETVTNMKVLKLYAWEKHFQKAAEKLRNEEMRWLSAVIMQKGLYFILFWSSPAIVATVTFYTCYFIGIPLDASNVFTFLATIRIIQEPIRLIADVAAVFIEARVALTRIIKFLEAPELQKERKINVSVGHESVLIKAEVVSWNDDCSKPTLTDVNLEISAGGKVAICGEVGSGKSTLISAILGEVTNIKGKIEVNGKVAYVSQTAWIQTGTVRDNILFGSVMDDEKYEVVKKCSLGKDIEMFPFGDQTIIGERGVNLSGGQKQRVQLARALYQDADIYLLDDPFSAVDAHTVASLFKDYIMEALSSKTVLLVTHQVDFLPTFDDILLMADGKIVQKGTYAQLLESCKEFQSLVISLSNTSGSDYLSANGSQHRAKSPNQEIENVDTREQIVGEQLIKQEEREAGDMGLKPYKQYLSQSSGYFYFYLSVLSHFLYVIGLFLQNLWLASAVQGSKVIESTVLLVYMVMAFVRMFFLFGRTYYVVKLGTNASIAVFSKLITSLFRAPMSFYDSTPS